MTTFTFKEPWDGDGDRVILNLSPSGLRFIVSALEDVYPRDHFTGWMFETLEAILEEVRQ